MKEKRILFMPHANIQYCQMTPQKREWVIRESYGKLLEVIDANDYTIAFEASGKTIDVIAEKAPDILAQLRRLIEQGKIEPVGSPYIHVTTSNVNPEIYFYNLKEGLLAWERQLGVRPKVGWSPECSWAYFVPEVYQKAGFETLILDADSFLLSFQEIREATGLKFDVSGHSNKNHLFKIEEYIQDKPDFLKYVTNPSRIDNGMHVIFRSDMMSNLMLWYLMGATEGYREEPVHIAEIKNMLQRWSKYVEVTGEFIMPYAEDAEYIGTTAYFYVKQFGKARFFEHAPESILRFQEILEAAISAGYTMSTPSEVIQNSTQIIQNPYLKNIEKGVAWHGGTSKAWANTWFSRLMDPVSNSVFDGIKAIAVYLGKNLETMDENLKDALRQVMASLVSDSRWPPEPTSPGRFDVKEALEALYRANDFIKKSMTANGISEVRSLYSPELMRTQIDFIHKELMAYKYFGEK